MTTPAKDTTTAGGRAGESGRDAERDRLLDAIVAVAAQQELLTNGRRMAIAYTIAAIMVPLFSSMDLLFRLVDPSWNLGAILAIRAVVTPVLVLGAWRSRRPGLGTRELHAWIAAAPMLLTTAMALSVMATGKLDSPYVPGLLLVAFGYPFVPQRYDRAIATGIYSTLIFPAFYVTCAFYTHQVAVMLAPREIVRLVTATAIHGSGIGVLVLAAHWLWALRREVFASRSIGRYRVRHCIGRGGMGEVWAAWDETLKREVALKVLRSDRQDPVAIARFEREVRATTELSHPNTVRVFDVGATEDGLYYYAMELLRGESLASLLRREKRLSPPRVVWLATQVARALAEAHARGIVHRDVKPENVFITHAGDEGDHAKVLDFGIARVLDVNDGLTETGLVGTPHYLAPEVLVGEKATPAADVYSLGVMLFQMVTGLLPFEPERGPLAKLASEPRSVRDLVPDVPDSLVDVLRRSLTLMPGERLADGRAIADALVATGLGDGYRPELAISTPKARPDRGRDTGDEETREAIPSVRGGELAGP